MCVWGCMFIYVHPCECVYLSMCVCDYDDMYVCGVCLYVRECDDVCMHM